MIPLNEEFQVLVVHYSEQQKHDLLWDFLDLYSVISLIEQVLQVFEHGSEHPVMMMHVTRSNVFEIHFA